MNHKIMPFLWLHGEDEKTYRTMVNAIKNSGINAFCIEARPHPEFIKEQWWKDVSIILDEASKLHMKVWILDDKHFPTGYAAGALENAPLSLKRRFIQHKSFKTHSLHKTVDELLKVHDTPKQQYWNTWLANNEGHPLLDVHQNELIGLTMHDQNEKMDLMSYIKDNEIHYDFDHDVTIDVCVLTYDSGARRDYINMIDEASCKVLIDTVYESHYEHFKQYFGNTIVGFFSDEPELGNGSCCVWNNTLGKKQSLPYSEALAKRLEERIGKEWKTYLSYLWNEYDKETTIKIRYIYMDVLTNLVSNCFNKQISDWCHRHNVQYIGHVIEDSNQHARTGCSLGHYFRGLKYQDMAGIDDIGGQVYPGMEDHHMKNIFGTKEDGEFYHYVLGKLAPSLAAISPHMHHQSFCEIFGNYGWMEGIQLEKYLLDHFMIRGINHFVPHAFTCKPYPDPDCPPHFYAFNHNPSYRPFGKLMDYATKMCELTSKSVMDIKVGILYHAEAEWCGKRMLMQKAARKLYDNQIDYHFIPADVFKEKDFYRTKVSDKIYINDQSYDVLIIPYCEVIPDEVVEELKAFKGKVIFMNAYPMYTTSGKKVNVKGEIVTINQLVKVLKEYKVLTLKPINHRVRIAHFKGNEDFYYLFNEGKERYQGNINLKGNYVYFDVVKDKYYKYDGNLVLEPYQSILLIHRDIKGDKYPSYRLEKTITNVTRSICTNNNYPVFINQTNIQLPDDYKDIDDTFSGIIRYEFNLDCENALALYIKDAKDCIEVFVNDKSEGFYLQPPYMIDLSQYRNDVHICIDIFTTLNNENNEIKESCGLLSQIEIVTII